MNVVMFYHSLVSDWNHGNAHFLRGIATELVARGHQVDIYEPRDSWSAQNLVAEHGRKPIREFHAVYPRLNAKRYDLNKLNLATVLENADIVLVHEWNDPRLVSRVGKHRSQDGKYALFFHDTHHRMVTEPTSMARYDLTSYDGVLAYGAVLRDLYESRGRARRAWTWHEAADTRVFHPIPEQASEGDLVWVGNWGDEERAAELNEFLIRPSSELHLSTNVYGVRYPEHATEALAEANIRYRGWLANFKAPRAFARHKVTVHVPRRPYVHALPGIPTIRPFEALACGIPLVCSPWRDTEELFTEGKDYLLARTGKEMTSHLRAILHEPGLAKELSTHGLRTTRSRHTCAHRVDELLSVYRTIHGRSEVPQWATSTLTEVPVQAAFEKCSSRRQEVQTSTRNPADQSLLASAAAIWSSTSTANPNTKPG